MSLWYATLRQAMAWVLRLYFREIKVDGLENIPKTGAVLFTVNHQNAFLDALLVVTSQNRLVHFLARADVFRYPIIRKLLASLYMMPIYRWRDGRQALNNNHEIFSKCYQLFNENRALLLFPEANHHQNRRLLPLSKGFTRITSGVDQNNPLRIIPVGINYTHHRRFGGSVLIRYGNPITPPTLEPGSRNYVEQLMNDVTLSMQNLITHISAGPHYHAFESHLNRNPWGFLKPETCNSWIREKALSPPHAIQQPASPSLIRRVILLVSNAINAIPLALCQITLNKIGDPVFSSSIKVLWALLIFPAYYLILALVLLLWASPLWTMVFISLSILSMLWRKWSLRLE